MFPGIVNANLTGYAGSFFQRVRQLVGACICFLISGGDLEALTDDILDREAPVGDPRDEAETGVTPSAERHLDRFVQPDATAPLPDYHNPVEPTTVSHRAITPLFAGTSPEAGRLNGRVSVFRLQNCPTCRFTGHVKMHFQYLTAWARVTLPSKKALNGRLAATLWDWCEERIEEHTKPKPKEDTRVEETTKVTVTEVTKPEEIKPKECIKSEEDAKPEEDIKPKGD